MPKLSIIDILESHGYEIAPEEGGAFDLFPEYRKI